MPKTRLTKSGNPCLNTYIEVELDHPPDTWELVKVVGIGYNKQNRLQSIYLEFDNGERQGYGFEGISWRKVSTRGRQI